jgi:hypothetical protein
MGRRANSFLFSLQNDNVAGMNVNKNNMTEPALLNTNINSKNGVKDEEKDGPSDAAATPLNVNISANESADDASPLSVKDRVTKAFWENDFLFLVIVSICVARAYPPLGAEYVYPDITATWVAVMLIFSKLLLCQGALQLLQFSYAH